MTTDARLATPGTVADERPRPRRRTRELQAFLTADRLEVFDIVRGAAPGTRRLVVGDPRTMRTTHVVALASDAAGQAAVDCEVRHLDDLALRLRPAIWATVPTVVSGIAIGSDRGWVLSAVPGAGVRRVAPAPASIAEHANAILQWLTAVWEDTAGTDGTVDLGREAVEALTSMVSGSPSATATIAMLERSRAAVADVASARTSTHGCLCPQHVCLRGGRVVGVDDWGLGAAAADPLRDLGCWVVTSAGKGIGAVLAGQAKTGQPWRELVADGLGYWGIPKTLWRDVLLLCLAESAVAGLANDDATSLDLLTSLNEGLFHTDERRDATS